MPRDRGEVRRRLQASALELYRTAGYDITTSAEIARHAGVTERTFFRHFFDKREVLFGGESVLAGLMIDALADAPPEPWAALLHVFRKTEAFFVESRETLIQRHAIIEVTPQLRERELAKTRTLTLALSDGLRERGTPADIAVLAARVAVDCFAIALSAWLTDDSTTLSAQLNAIFASIGKLIAIPHAS